MPHLRLRGLLGTTRGGLHARRRYDWVDHPIVSALDGRGDRGWCYADAWRWNCPCCGHDGGPKHPPAPLRVG